MKLTKPQFLFLILFFSLLRIHAQKKTYIDIGLDFSGPQSKSYFFNDSENAIYNEEIEETGLLLYYGINASYEYFLLNKWSVGILAGINTDSQQKFSHLRLGGILKYYYITEKKHHFFLSVANNKSLNKNKYTDGTNLKLGMAFPFYSFDNKTFILDLFWEQNYYKMDGANKLLNLPDELPRSLTVKSLGLGFHFYF